MPRTARRLLSGDGSVTAILGPTNTGKTHQAIERLLRYPSGMIGLPLRLLAREVYDRIVARRGAERVALITGEERIVPDDPRYFVCTVEAMPDRQVSCLVVDEIQLAADPVRGHVFTERLLHARGVDETLFLGSDSAEQVLSELIPGIVMTRSPRFSELRFSGACKIRRLPRRSAVVAFSAADVYALADQLKAVRGGAAVVLGALSPRTRNAQVEMFQNGEVDYLVATDAIGMGLNLDLDHVALRGLEKFDGRRVRSLSLAEIGQIAGRAGRFKRDGTFGTITGVTLPEDHAAAISSHTFPVISTLYWRNHRLDFHTMKSLVASLCAHPPHARLIRAGGDVDQRVLEDLSDDPELTARACTVSAVKLIWEVCKIPDYRKTLTGDHKQLLREIALHLLDHGTLPDDWFAERIKRLDRVDGDIETLMSRLAYVRTWTYVSHRARWLDDAAHWQGIARGVEERISDALHERLTQRFVDRRSLVLEREALQIRVEGDRVLADAFVLGRLVGLSLERGQKSRLLSIPSRVLRGLEPELSRRIARVTSGAEPLVVDEGKVTWEGELLGFLKPGKTWFDPRLKLAHLVLLDSRMRARLDRGLTAWIRTQVLPRPQGGLAGHIALHGGLVDARTVRGRSGKGVRIGQRWAFLTGWLDAASVSARARMWGIFRGHWPPPPPGNRACFRVQGEQSKPFLQACGYVRLRRYAVRVDVAEDMLLAMQRMRGPFRPDPGWGARFGMERVAVEAILEALGAAVLTDGRLLAPGGGRSGRRRKRTR